MTYLFMGHRRQVSCSFEQAVLSDRMCRAECLSAAIGLARPRQAKDFYFWVPRCPLIQKGTALTALQAFVGARRKFIFALYGAHLFD